MSNSFLGPKPVRSVAAFLWMPQFRLSFQHMSHLTPVFIRTLAMVFVQAGLLPRNHPALMYGIAGVKKYGFSEIIGEAWFALRTTRATPNQWGLFIAVMLMIAMVIGSLATFMMTVAFGFGTPAQAQLFSHPNGPSNAGSYPGPGGSPFDLNIPAAGTAQGDYGIMLLDKVIRAGATGQGVPLQNATRALMEVYNSGVLVVASVILFWIVISVVVDTAKTGQVGGGRHNMVWAPMRIVFALGLLIPLGSAGYSSGQYMVMKLAEWGSNLGTRGWVAYVDAITSGQSLIAGNSPFSPTTVVVSYQKMWMCRIAYNANEIQTGGNLRVNKILRDGAEAGEKTFSFTTANHENLCGSITYEEGSPTNIESLTSLILDPITPALMSFKTNMRIAYMNALLSLDTPANNLACKFVSTFPQFKDDGATDLTAAGCGPTALNLAAVPHSDIETMVANFGNTIKSTFDAEMATLAAVTGGSSFTDMLKNRGWAGMGSWYHRISQLNGVIGSVLLAPMHMGAGSLATMNPADSPDVIDRTQEILQRYDSWWSDYANQVTGGAKTDTATGITRVNATQVSVSQADSESLVGALKNANPSNALDLVVDGIGMTSNTWLTSLVAGTANGTNSQVYPMALLANIGGNMVVTGATIMGAHLIFFLFLSVLSTGVSFFGSGVDLDLTALSNAYPFEFASKLGAAILAAGMMLKFYVPLIPFIRTVFSVLTWIISVFEAVALVPIAALAHLTTEGEGLAGSAKQAWMLWLNILLRPILTVLGYVGALLVFNGFVAYFNDSFVVSIGAGLPTKGILGLLTGIVVAVAYVFIMYTAANTVFKMLDIVPNALMRWMGGTADQSFDDQSDRGIMYAASNMIANSGNSQVSRDKMKSRVAKRSEATPNASEDKTP